MGSSTNQISREHGFGRNSVASASSSLMSGFGQCYVKLNNFYEIRLISLLFANKKKKNEDGFRFSHAPYDSC